MAWTQIGTATTNENGIATLSYESTGAGETVIRATNSDGSIVSETYELLDALVYDNGISSDYNDGAWDSNTYLTISRGDDGTSVTNGTSGNLYLVSNIASGTVYDYTPPVCIEFDFEKLNTGTANSQIQIYDSDNNNFANWITTTGHYKININSDEVTWTINNVAQTSKTVTLGTIFVRFLLAASASFKFKNFKIYSI